MALTTLLLISLLLHRRLPMAVLMYKESKYLVIHFIAADKKQEISKNEMKKKSADNAASHR